MDQELVLAKIEMEIESILANLYAKLKRSSGIGLHEHNYSERHYSTDKFYIEISILAYRKALAYIRGRKSVSIKK